MLHRCAVASWRNSFVHLFNLVDVGAAGLRVDEHTRQCSKDLCTISMQVSAQVDVAVSARDVVELGVHFNLTSPADNDSRVGLIAGLVAVIGVVKLLT